MIASMAAGRRGALGKLLAASGLPRSTYYFELRKADADGKNSELFELIGRIFARHRGNYGVRRVHRALLALGVAANHKKVQRIMRKLGLSARKHPRRYHSYQGHVGAVAGNLIRRDFGADRPNRKWTTDVSQFSLPWGKCYLSPIMDMYNNEIVGYDLSTRADYAQIERMLASAGVGSRDLAGLTIHSDQGWQYQNPRFVRALADNGIRQSMSRKGNCMDNAIMESFFAIMKNEMFYGHEAEFRSFKAFSAVVDDYISYYNCVRIKRKTGWKPPVQYRLEQGFAT